MSVTQSQLQSTVNGYFPIQCDEYMDEDSPVSVTLSDPVVLLEDGSDRMGLKVAISAEANQELRPVVSKVVKRKNAPALPGLPGALRLPGRNANPESSAEPDSPEHTGLTNGSAASPRGTVTASGKISYRSDEGAFYILDAAVDEVQFQKSPPAAVDAAIRKIAGQVLNRYLTKNAVYTLSGEDSTSKTARLLLKSISIQNGEMKVELGR